MLHHRKGHHFVVMNPLAHVNLQRQAVAQAVSSFIAKVSKNFVDVPQAGQNVVVILPYMVGEAQVLNGSPLSSCTGTVFFRFRA